MVSILSRGPWAARQVYRKGLQADAGADFMRVFVRFWGLSTVGTGF